MIDSALDLEPFDQESDAWWVFLLPDVCGAPIFRTLIEALKRHNLELLGLEGDDDEVTTVIEAVLRDRAGNHLLTAFTASDTPRLYLGTYARYFLPPEGDAAKAYADLFVGLAKTCYEVLHPMYAFSEDLNTFIDDEDIRIGSLRRIFWSQMLGPGLVRNIGRGLLLEAPVWRNETLADGGMLLTVAASPFLYRGADQTWDEIRGYLAKKVSTPLTWGDQMR